MHEPNRRGEVRTAAIKKALIVFDNLTVDCVVLDVSSRGARVRTGAPVTIPEHVALRFSGGALQPAIRRWMRGVEIGFEFTGAAILNDDATWQAQLILEVFRNRGFEAVHVLRAVRFFDDPALRHLAEMVEVAHAQLEAALSERARTSGIECQPISASIRA